MSAQGAAIENDVQRPPPARPRGPGGGAQAPRHVHRVHRHPRASCTACGRSSTTPSTRRWRVRHADRGRRCTPTASIEVHDDGRGIPVDVEPKTGLSGVEVVFTKLHAGGKFGGGSYNATGGLHGVGASVVNALSARLDVEVDRGRRPTRCRSGAACPGVFDGDGPTRAVHAAAAGCARCGTGQEGRHRHPGPLLARPADLHQGRRARPRRAASRRARQTAFLVPGPDARRSATSAAPSRVEERSCIDGGIAEFCRVPRPRRAGHRRASGCRARTRFNETVPVLDDAGHMTPQDVERELDVDVALRWGDRLRHRAARRSSTSSPRPRAAPTSPASSAP